MARIERFTSTEQVPVERAQLIDPSAFRFGTAIPETLGKIGGVLTELGRRKLAADDSLAINAAGESRDLAKLQMQQFMLDNPDPDTWTEGAAKILSDQRKIYTQQKFSAEVKPNEDIEQRAFTDEFLTGVQIANVTQTIALDIKASSKNYITTFSEGDGSEASEIAIAKQEGLLMDALLRRDRPDIAAIEMAEILSQAEKQRITVLVNEARNLAEQGARIELVEEKLKEAREFASETKGLIPSERVAQLRLIDITETQIKRKTIDLDHEADMKVNEDFVSRIFSKDLIPDEIQNSRLDDKTPRGIFSTEKLSKQEWMQYASSSFEDPPKKTTPKGFGAASNTVLNYAKFKIPKEKAYRQLLDSRYIHKEITDEDFAWAIEHINNPYPPHLVADIESVTQSNAEAISKGGFLWGLITTDAEEEKARVVNSDLISWIDNEIAQGREPTREQMYGQSAQLRAQSGGEVAQRPVIDTQAEYDKLKSGTEFQDAKTGEFFRKP